MVLSVLMVLFVPQGLDAGEKKDLCFHQGSRNQHQLSTITEVIMKFD